MTALDRYDRLESLARWRPDHDSPEREVVVSFGASTLVIRDKNDAPLAHWSLPAISTLSQTDTAATYTVEQTSGEVLVVQDSEMREALATIEAHIAHTRDRRTGGSRASKLFWLFGFMAFVAAVVMLLPAFMNDMAHRLISPERADVLANEMLPLIEERTGPACAAPAGAAALQALANTLAADGVGKAFVVELGDIPVVSLPNENVVLNRGVIERATSPTELAGWVAVGFAGSEKSPALAGLFDMGGTFDGIKFLLTGDLPRRAMNRSINRLLISSSALTAPVEQQVADIMVAAGQPGAEFAVGLRREGVSSGLAPWTIEPTQKRELLSDEQWVALQNICEE